MKESVSYDQKTDTVWLSMKDTRTMINGKWIQDWYLFNGEKVLRLKGSEKAAMILKGFILLQSSRYLDEYRGY